MQTAPRGQADGWYDPRAHALSQGTVSSEFLARKQLAVRCSETSHLVRGQSSSPLRVSSVISSDVTLLMLRCIQCTLYSFFIRDHVLQVPAHLLATAPSHCLFVHRV